MVLKRSVTVNPLQKINYASMGFDVAMATFLIACRCGQKSHFST